MSCDEDLFAEFFDGLKVRLGFGGIGNFRGRSDYTKDEKTVLAHFFTNTESNVYCAKDNMPSELWAQLMGQYARSDQTVRDRLLKLFNDVKDEDKSGKVSSLEEIAGLIRREGDVGEALKSHLKRAGEWIEKYGIDYGHASLRDSGIIRICFEGVSQRATKPLERAREGAYQEQSTRATPFKKENLAVPFEIRGTFFEKEMLVLGDEAIALYDKVFEKAQKYLRKKYGHLIDEADDTIRRELNDVNANLPDVLWNGVVREKAFDLARSLLPQNITTSLGMTMNTRRFMDMLTEWQSSELAEVRILGRVAQLEAMKISPTLMKHGGRSEFVASQPEIRRELFNKMVDSPQITYENTPLKSEMISHTPKLEENILASILFHGSNGSISFDTLIGKVFSMNAEQKREIAMSYVGDMGVHDLFEKVAEVGNVTFERVYDIGAMRDLQRQRGDRQQLGNYTVVGYHMRPEIEEIGLKKEFEELMNKVKELHDKMKEVGYHIAAEYVPLMANTIRHVVTKDPVQCFYEAELRTQAAGADSYREIALQEIKQVLDVLPSFRGLIPYDEKIHPLNRLNEKVNGYIRDQKRKRGLS